MLVSFKLICEEGGKIFESFHILLFLIGNFYDRWSPYLQAKPWQVLRQYNKHLNGLQQATNKYFSNSCLGQD